MFRFSGLKLFKFVIGRRFSSAALDAESRVLTESCLVDSCILSLEDPVAASNKVCIRYPEDTNPFIALLKNYDLNDDQISKIVRICPRFLMSKAEQRFRPKIEFLLSIGVTRDDLGTLLYRNPKILDYSLENGFMPFYNFLKNVAQLEDEDIVRALKGSFRVFRKDAHKKITYNVTKLRELGTPPSLISMMVATRTSLALLNSETFDRVVKELINMGFKPRESKFINAMTVLGVMSESTRELKRGVYRRRGWSEEDIQSAFRRSPVCMMYSENKISDTIGFLVDGMHYSPSAVARDPMVIGYSLRTRIVPRCSVFKVLQARGYIRRSLSFGVFLRVSEKDFLNKFVIKYNDEIPDLMLLYQGKITFEKLIAR